MPRKRTIPDQDLLDAALLVVREGGPDALTFGVLAPRTGLAASTLVQRFGTKPALLRAALARAWDLLDADTAQADAEAGSGPAGVVDLLVALSGQYDAHGDYGDALLILREDLRDPVLRDRGRAWVATLVAAIERRLEPVPGGASGLGVLVVAHWQGLLTVWAFTRDEPLRTLVRRSLGELLDRLRLDAAADPAPAPPVAPTLVESAPPAPATAPADAMPVDGRARKKAKVKGKDKKRRAR